MPTTALSGKSGSVGGTAASEIKRWSCDISAESLDASSMDSSGMRDYVAGIIRGEGSFDAVGTVPAVGSVNLVLTTASGGNSLTGVAYIDKVTYTTEANGLVNYGATFKFSGSITVA
jgi:hypothetical protein